MNMKKGLLFSAIALLPLLAVCLDVVFAVLEMTVFRSWYRDPRGLSQSLLHWGLVCLVWGLSAAGIFILSKKAGFDLSAARKTPSALRFFLMACVVAAGIVYMASTWDFRFKPFAEWEGFERRFDSSGGWAFCFQYLYYLFESLLITWIIALGQRAGEAFFPQKWSAHFPWGGIFCTLTWGMLHGLTKDWNTALLCILLSLMFEAVYLLADRNIRYAYPAVALIFLL